MVPFSTDSRGRYISHVVSAGSGSKNETDAENLSAPGSRRRVARGAPQMPSVTSSSGQHLFFNVTLFGKDLHLRLRANRRLVAPGAFVEWQEDFEEKTKERIHGDCVFTGDVTDMPEASVAISNCDGLSLGFITAFKCVLGCNSIDRARRAEPLMDFYCKISHVTFEVAGLPVSSQAVAQAFLK
ncbi:hypothetical protein CRENBAI_006681 [Crenichthys baileyi]|uniref:Peptidase M12B propeptide domain-containing protein n=1 Tax=Crenichthys baileyi TaxID=28760 RepID=A0AAV9QUR4_9TELE